MKIILIIIFLLSLLTIGVYTFGAEPSLELLETQLALANSQLEAVQLRFVLISKEQARLTAEIEKKKAEAKAATPAPEPPK